MFNTNFELRFVEIRHFMSEDYPTFLKCIKGNLDHIADYLGEGRFFKGFSDYEFLSLFKGYMANESPFEYFGAFYKDICIGMVMLCPGNSTHGAEVVYWVDSRHMNHGVATKMVGEISEHAFQLGYWSVECHTDISNIASQKVLEKNSFGLAEKYSIDPRGFKDSGQMIIWLRFNPYSRNPFGPKKSALDLLRTRTLHLSAGWL